MIVPALPRKAPRCKLRPYDAIVFRAAGQSHLIRTARPMKPVDGFRCAHRELFFVWNQRKNPKAGRSYMWEALMASAVSTFR